MAESVPRKHPKPKSNQVSIQTLEEFPPNLKLLSVFSKLPSMFSTQRSCHKRRKIHIKNYLKADHQERHDLGMNYNFTHPDLIVVSCLQPLKM